MNAEVDQSLLYSQPHGPRTPEQSRAVRKKIIFVTVLLSVITVFEVLVGVFYGKGAFTTPEDAWKWQGIKIMYIVLTLIKAGYIVLVFMHLGDEKKNLRMTILLPMLFVVYLIWIALYEGGALIAYLRALVG
jgi:cytochrome c oxidase subunit IV